MSGVTCVMLGMKPNAAVVNISDVTVYDTQVSPTDASASYTLENDGDIIESTGAGNADTGDWVTPKAAAGAAYECRATITSGALTSGTTGSWLSMATTRTWTVTRTNNAAGVDTCVFTLEIRLTATGTVLDTATITLTAEVF